MMAGPSGSSTSSLTSTSHALTQAPGMASSSLAASSKPAGVADSSALLDAIKAGNRGSFLQPTASLSKASLQLAKSTLDAYAAQVSDEQQMRQRQANKKRKRADQSAGQVDVLKIRKLHVEGFESGQIWQQAQRIISSTLQTATDALKELDDREQVQTTSAGDAVDQAASAQDGAGIDSGESENEEAEYCGLSEMDEEDKDVSESDEEPGQPPLGDPPTGTGEEIEEEEDVDDEDQRDGGHVNDPPKALVQDPHGLNDGFFSIDEFNRQTQWFEEQDARANPNTDQASEDEEIDWHTNPYSSNSVAERPGTKAKDEKDEDSASEAEDDEDDEEGGPTFGDMDLNAPEGESEDEDEEDVDGLGDFNANDVFYKDFFAPPRRKATKARKSRRPKDSPPMQPDDNDVDRAMADVRRDLFDDESERSGSEDALSDVSAGDPKSRKSAHERRQAKLAEEIRELEAANVAKREWALSGEAKAADRPVNSLLEEDLEFEHVGKPVPVITPEVSESIEELVKRRILAREFDEVLRRRPDVDAMSATTRRGLVELDDTKAKQGLAELYEEEHIKNTNPDTYVSKSDEKLRREEKELEQMWKEISAKLDGLSSWHYKPKPAAPSLSVVSNVAAVSMEDAQPATAQGVSGGDHGLAPQEVYAPGRTTAEKGELVAKSGLPMAKQEMSREDKQRRRRRQKERIRKAGGEKGGSGPATGKARERKDTIGDLKKGGVRVINRKGEILDVEGNKAKAAKTAPSSSSFKL